VIKKLFESKLNQILILLLLISLPFERLLTVEIAGDTFKFSYLFGLLLVVYFLLSLLSKRLKFQLRREELWLLLFVALNFLSLIWSIDRIRTLFVSGAILLVVLIFMSFRRLVSKIDLKFVEKLIILIGVAASIFGLWQFIAGSIPVLEKFAFLRPQYQSGIFGFPRVQSTFLEPLYLANFLILPLFLAIKKVISSRRGLDFIYLILISTAFFLTLSRGAEYAVIIALIILALIIALTDRKWLRDYAFSILSIVFGIALGTAMVYMSAGGQGIKNYFGHATDTNLVTSEGTTDRSSTSEVAEGTFLNNPLGIGSGAFGALPVYKGQISAQGYQTVNNEYLEILAEDGVIGFIFFGLFILGFLVYLVSEIKKGRKEAVYLLAAILAMLIQYLAFSTLYISYFWVFLAVIWPVSQADKQVS
jgi:O-antigen ligase